MTGDVAQDNEGRFPPLAFLAIEIDHLPTGMDHTPHGATHVDAVATMGGAETTGRHLDAVQPDLAQRRPRLGLLRNRHLLEILRPQHSLAEAVKVASTSSSSFFGAFRLSTSVLSNMASAKRRKPASLRFSCGLRAIW